MSVTGESRELLLVGVQVEASVQRERTGRGRL